MCSTRWAIYYGVLCHWGHVTSNTAAILAATLDFTKIENLTGKGENDFFFCWTLKMWYKNILPLFVHILYFFRRKKWKNTHFSSKMVLPPVTCDVISRNYSNWCSPILIYQNVCKGYAHGYWKRRVEMIIRLGKIKEKLYRGDCPSPLPPRPVGPRVNKRLCHWILLPFKTCDLFVPQDTHHGRRVVFHPQTVFLRSWFVWWRDGHMGWRKSWAVLQGKRFFNQ